MGSLGRSVDLRVRPKGVGDMGSGKGSVDRWIGRSFERAQSLLVALLDSIACG